MKKHLLFLIIPLFFSSCEKEEKLPSIIVSGKKTVLVYMMAENTLSNFSVDDINEMMQGMKEVGNDGNLIVYLDDYSNPRLIKIDKDESGNVSQKVVWNYEEHDSTDPKIMYEVFERTFTTFPSESYGLIFWSHADGWLPDFDMNLMRWFGQDGRSFMNILAIDEVLQQTLGLLKPVNRFDFILFDACYMQSIEVVYQLHRYADYFIGAPIEIPGPGAPYQKLVPQIFAASFNAEGIAKAYYDFYTNSSSYPMKNSSGKIVWYQDYGVAVSLVKSEELDSLARIIERILPKYSSNLVNFDVTNIQNFDVRARSAYYDLGDFMKNLVSDDEYVDFEAQLKKAVPYARAADYCFSSYNGGKLFHINKYSGISTYIPRPLSSYEKWNSFIRTYKWYHASGWNKTGW